jgi:hypothetical protein
MRVGGAALQAVGDEQVQRHGHPVGSALGVVALGVALVGARFPHVLA